MKCSFCGFEFSPDSACRGCPLAKGCKIICCTNCGYQTVVESGIVKLIKKIKLGGMLWLRIVILRKKF